ncbi:MAG: TetR family transcriptional regulator [Solirubrobacterales bacterium]|nr:TetR family transcriptional regulator [Solirubrobacterales bacterium]
MSGQTTGSPRDPEARRRAIVEAATELILDSGVNDLTHRRVAARAGVPLGSTTYYFGSLDELKEAALELLAVRIDLELEAVSAGLADSTDIPASLARMLHHYLADRERMQAETAFYVAGTQNPELRPLATRWFNGLVGILSGHTDPATARAVGLFTDGLTFHASLAGPALDERETAEALTHLLERSDA